MERMAGILTLEGPDGVRLGPPSGPRPRSRTLATVVMCLMTAVACCAQDEIAAGPWSVTFGDMGPEAIAYQGETIARGGRLGGYLPAWKGARFGMGGAERTVQGASAAWHKAEPDNADATLTVRPVEDRLVFSLDMTVSAAGPSEFALQLVPEAVRTDEDRCLLCVGDELRQLPLDESFDRIGGLKQLRFERADRTVTVGLSSTVGSWEMQDRRAQGAGLFLVVVIGSSGEEPRHVDSSIELSVTAVPEPQRAAKAAFVSQRPQERTALEVRNPGFEEVSAKDGAPIAWTKNPHAVLDSEEKTEGRQSARLTITGDVQESGHVYLVQSVPVEEGHWYQAEAQIKTEDVTAATPSGMASTGGTIIVEFADKQGKWFASGSYAQGLYGTNNWRRTATGVVRAPEGAGFATIYLALRAHGTAWFDAVKMTEIRHRVCLIGPHLGARLPDNTPRLRWYGMASQAEVELSTDESFPADRVVRVPATSEDSVALEEPIPPGTWYWRVRVPHYAAESDVWSFEQTASLDQDTTEPKIAATHAFLPGAKNPLIVRYSDNVGVAKTTLTVDDEDVTAQARVSATEAQYAPQRGWSDGLHRALVRVEDEAGGSAERTVYFTHVRRMPKTVWLQRGGVETDGQKRFVLGIYGINTEHMPKIAEAGFDFVHNYRWDGTGTNEEAIEYLDAAQEHGLQAFIGINRRELMRGNFDFVAERVGALMTHPGLLAWYLFDEPDLAHQYVPPDLLEQHYRLIKTLDPFHPVVVTCAGDAAVERYRDALDVHWTQVYGSTSFVASRSDKHRASLRPDTPLALILHCYDRAKTSQAQEGGEVTPEGFQPDARVIRANVYMALAHNASGLIWWWYGQGGDSYTVAHAPQEWAALRDAVRELKSLEPLLIADGEPETWVERPTEETEIHCWEKRCPDRTVLIAVNRSEEPCEAEIKPRTLPEDCRLRVRFEGREARVEGGVLRDRFEGLAAHVYELEGKP